jgi:2-oxoglutarate dehydrogenase E1 component
VCSGQIYYDLIEEEKREASKTSLSAEWKQIAPFPFDRIQHMGAKYSKAAFHWVQEEPLNLGPWNYVWPRLDTALLPLGFDRVSVISRSPHAAAATGYPHVHSAELARLLDQAME